MYSLIENLAIVIVILNPVCALLSSSVQYTVPSFRLQHIHCDTFKYQNQWWYSLIERSALIVMISNLVCAWLLILSEMNYQPNTPKLIINAHWVLHINLLLYIMCLFVEHFFIIKDQNYIHAFFSFTHISWTPIYPVYYLIDSHFFGKFLVNDYRMLLIKKKIIKKMK